MVTLYLIGDLPLRVDAPARQVDKVVLEGVDVVDGPERKVARWR